jgi:Leucine Rich Repeat (LRR) protein
MSRVIEQNTKSEHRAGLGLWFLLMAACFPAFPSCQNVRTTGSRTDGLSYVPGSGTQAGEVTVREGTDVEVRYTKPYQAAPRLILVELRGAKALEALYSKDEFQIVRQEATGFRIRNNHTEHGESWATVKWQAEGTLAQGGPGGLNANGDALANGNRSAQELLIERIKNAGGKVTVDPNPPKEEEPALAVASRDANTTTKNAIDVTLTSTVDPRLAKNGILAIDLHRKAVTDPDLEVFGRLHSLRTLNLYGTKITDAGLKSLSELNNLATLYLNDTAVTDAGLQYLQGLKKLSDLGLNQTKVTDAGLPYLQGLTNLHSLSLSGTKVTDRGLEQLKVLRNLKHLYVGHTGVTATGIQELKRALPNLEISK